MKRYPIVVADDNFDDQLLIENAIRSHGPHYDVHYVYNGNQLLDFILKKGRYQEDLTVPSAIIMDLKMPFLDGFGVLEALRGCTVSIPIYILSSLDAKRNDARFLKLGVRGYYTKPFHTKEFQSVIDDILQDVAVNGRLKLRNAK